MSVVAFTFGSFGDITTVLQLAWSLRRSLSDASGASSEITAVIAIIDSFTCALQSVDAAMKEAPKLSTPTQNAITHLLSTCTRILRDLTNLIESHRKRIEGQHGKRIWRAYWAACAWTILGRKVDVETLNKQLTSQADALGILLQAIHCESLSEINRKLDHGGLEVTLRHHSTESLSGRFKTGGLRFHFTDGQRRAVKPLLNISYLRFKDLCTQFQFTDQLEGIPERNKVHEQVIYSGNGRKAWLEFILYDDSEYFGLPSVLVSPVFHILGKMTVPPLSTAEYSVDKRQVFHFPPLGGTLHAPCVQFLAGFCIVGDPTYHFADARVSNSLTKLIEFGDLWLFRSTKQPRNTELMRTLDDPNGRYLRLTIAHVWGDEYSCNLATMSLRHVVAARSEYFGF